MQDWIYELAADPDSGTIGSNARSAGACRSSHHRYLGWGLSGPRPLVSHAFSGAERRLSLSLTQAKSATTSTMTAPITSTIQMVDRMEE
jgi:hypothetical protein